MTQVFLIFLRLGLTSFGGPVAHIGYFRSEFVVRRRWLEEEAYAAMVSFCQFLPGPASSQVAMTLGLTRAGLPGLVAAWLESEVAVVVAAVAVEEVVAAEVAEVAVAQHPHQVNQLAVQ